MYITDLMAQKQAQDARRAGASSDAVAGAEQAARKLGADLDEATIARLSDEQKEQLAELRRQAAAFHTRSPAPPLQ